MGDEAVPGTHSPMASPCGGQRQGLVMGIHNGPQPCEGVGQAGGPAGDPRQVEAGGAVVQLGILMACWCPRGPELSFCVSLVSREKQTSSLIVVKTAEKRNGK